MGLLSLFKLEKLKISAYAERERSTLWRSMEVMFNPASFEMKHQNVFHRQPGINTAGREARYSHSRSDKLTLDLLFDGTGVGELGLLNLIGKGADSVADQVKKFLEIGFYMDGKIHRPRFLKIEWGKGPLEDYRCVLDSATISYQAFEKDGSPLRASVKAVFVEDVIRDVEKSSPDLSHSRVVKAGDTLPLLCKEIYGSSEHYLWLAAKNDLDDFRNLVPGETILFPPLDG